MKHNLNDIENEYLIEDKSDARCPHCGAFDIGIEQSIKDGVVSHNYICNECETEFL